MDSSVWNVVASKMDYLKELRKLINGDAFVDEKTVLERISKVCDSIETDLGITPPS